MFEQKHLDLMKDAISLFNDQKYWECHEVLEDLWLEDRQDPIRNIYWAVIQVAAVCIHYRDHNLIGCQGMIAKAKNKFERCHESHVVNPFLTESLSWNHLEALVMKIPQDSHISDFKDLFDFRFKTK